MGSNPEPIKSPNDSPPLQPLRSRVDGHWAPLTCDNRFGRVLSECKY